MADPLEAPSKKSPNAFPLWMRPAMTCAAAISWIGYCKMSDIRNFHTPIILSLIMGILAFRLLEFMEAVDTLPLTGKAPHFQVTVAFLALSLALFWVPFAGLILVSYAVDRMRWFEFGAAVEFCISSVFMLAVGFTFVTALIIGLEK